MLTSTKQAESTSRDPSIVSDHLRTKRYWKNVVNAVMVPLSQSVYHELSTALGMQNYELHICSMLQFVEAQSE